MREREKERERGKREREKREGRETQRDTHRVNGTRTTVWRCIVFIKAIVPPIVGEAALASWN